MKPAALLPTVNRFGVIIAVYLGAYLVLPGCLCQVLGAFGLTTKQELREPVPVIGSVASNLPCHCHDAPGKFAEPALATAVEMEHFASVTAMPEIGIAIPPVDPALRFHQGRAPPPAWVPASNRLRDFTRIYLI